MYRKSFYPARRHLRRASRKRPLLSRRHPHTLPIASLVEEVQDAVCYIDFTQNYLYSNDELRSLCPSITTQRFQTIQDMNKFFYETFAKNGAPMSEVFLIWDELLTNRTGCCPKMEEKSLQIGERTIQLIFNFTHTPRGVFIMWRDITEVIRFEEQKDSFLAELSHEFRSPLTAINGYAELLMYQYSDDDKTHGMLALVKREAERLERLVDNFLDYQRVHYSEDLLKQSHFELKSILEEIVSHYETTSPKHKILLEAVQLTIEADQEKLLQLLHNLISNAIKYSPEGGTVHITLTKEKETYILSVQDSGIGIPSDAIPHVFDEYYRVDSEAHRSIKGTGLGLRICKRIVEAHGWGIDAESVYGEGTTFSIYLYSNN